MAEHLEDANSSLLAQDRESWIFYFPVSGPQF